MFKGTPFMMNLALIVVWKPGFLYTQASGTYLFVSVAVTLVDLHCLSQGHTSCPDFLVALFLFLHVHDILVCNKQGVHGIISVDCITC